MKYNEVSGNLISMALSGAFDVICHGVNCQNVQGAGIALQMKSTFGTDKFEMEKAQYKGDINKLGQIDYSYFKITDNAIHRVSYFNPYNLIVCNCYTQYNYGRNHLDGDLAPVDYEAITLCMRKINNVFKGKHIGNPAIGAGLAGGNIEIVKKIFKKELKDCDVTLVLYDGK